MYSKVKALSGVAPESVIVLNEVLSENVLKILSANCGASQNHKVMGRHKQELAEVICLSLFVKDGGEGGGK